MYEDVIFTPEILYELKTLVTVPEVYYYYWRRGGSSVTLKSEKANNDSVYAHEKAKKFFVEHNIDVSKQEVYTKRYKFFGITVFKIITKGNLKTFNLFNFIKIKVKTKKG